MYGDSTASYIDTEAVCQPEKRQSILIASSDSSLRDQLEQYLNADFDLIISSNSKDTYKQCLSNNSPDLVLMDTHLTSSDGYTTCKIIKEHEKLYNISVVLISNKWNLEDELNAFKHGADDFIINTINQDVLFARLKVSLRHKRMTDLLEQYARLDSLVEIPNRREFDRVIEIEWRQAIHTKKPLAVALLEIDFFNEYKDTYGYMEGDRCLKTIAQLLENSLERPIDFVARYGGSQFILVLPDTDKEGVLSICNKIEKSLTQLNIPHVASNKYDHVTFSQGASCIIPEPSKSPAILVETADHALFSAKNHGRNQVVFRDPV